MRLAVACLLLPALLVSRQGWSFEGPFGSFDLASAQRGYAVYAQVCAACHSMRALRFADLAGLGLDTHDIHAIAASHGLQAGDHFPSPYANDVAARAANHGAVPPDQSRLAITLPGGARFIAAFLDGFLDTPRNVALAPRMHYNLAVAGNATAMPPPLHQGQVDYADGTKATVPHMAHDVATFLAWAAQPHLQARHRLGVQVIAYLTLLLGLVVIVKRRVWANVRT
ncbi:cytochrome c1 [Lichenicoccus sp.]|uniref:cytochrome c1 n=1 Tax=Lichenicoccus sp. TaxID=2781899 RepID=UPI003D0E1AC2